MRNEPIKAPPSDDKRWRIVGATMRHHGYQPDALIETLHTVQESFGFLDEDSLRYVAAALHVPLSQVYGVATFYHAFNLKPAGAHTCVVCMGTACYIKGAPNIMNALDQQFELKPGETTEDNKASLLIARCLGACGLAPAAVFDGEVHGKLTSDQVVEQVRAWQEEPAEVAQ